MEVIFDDGKKLGKEIASKATKLSEYQKKKWSCIRIYERFVIPGVGHYWCKL